MSIMRSESVAFYSNSWMISHCTIAQRKEDIYRRIERWFRKPINYNNGSGPNKARCEKLLNRKKKLDKAQNFIALRQDNELACFTMLTLKQLALRFCDLIWWCNWCAIGCTRLRIQLIMSNGNTSPICLSTFYFRQSCQRESCGLISCRSEP